MADQYTVYTHNSWADNIMKSFVGSLIGIVLFFGAFVLLWWNEGRINLADVARTSRAVDAASIDPAGEGKLVAISGSISSPDQVGDPRFMPAGPYIALDRTAEMYAWKERESSETRKEVGGGSTTKTTYTYDEEWTEHPANSNNFRFSSGHTNPPMAISSDKFVVARASVGAYPIDTHAISLPDGQPVPLGPGNVQLNDGQRLAGNYIYSGPGSLDAPRIGDIRISFSALPSGANVTAIGLQSGGRLVNYTHRTGDKLYRVFIGSREDAIAQLNTEYQMITWLLRLAGFLMLWFGLGAVLGPLNTLLDVLPALGSMSRFLTGAITFAIAFVLWGITVLVAIIAHSLVAMIVVLLLILGGVVGWSRLRPAAAR
jgi:hypothetical protein